MKTNAVRAIDPPPPGEDGIELTGSDAITAMHQALVSVTQPANKRYTVRDIDFVKVGRWVVLKAKLQDGQGRKHRIEFEVRMPRARALLIWQRLSLVVDR